MSYDYEKHWEYSTFEATQPPDDWTRVVRNHLFPGSVVDIGCGTGRFIDLFVGREYLGLDISRVSTNIARTTYPELRFEIADIVNWTPDKKYSNAFTWTTLEHIPPEYIEQAAENIKKAAYNILIIEPAADGSQWAPHCFPHDYEKLFEVYAREKLGSVTFYQARGYDEVPVPSVSSGPSVEQSEAIDKYRTPVHPSLKRRKRTRKSKRSSE